MSAAPGSLPKGPAAARGTNNSKNPCTAVYTREILEAIPYVSTFKPPDNPVRSLIIILLVIIAILRTGKLKRMEQAAPGPAGPGTAGI